MDSVAERPSLVLNTERLPKGIVLSSAPGGTVIRLSCPQTLGDMEIALVARTGHVVCVRRVGGGLQREIFIEIDPTGTVSQALLGEQFP